MRVFFSENHRLHFPQGELHGGELVTPFERPSRVEYVLRRLAELAKDEPDFPGINFNADQAGGVTYEDIFHVCRTFEIPLLLEVGDDLQEQARNLFNEIPDVVEFVDPSAILTRARRILETD